MPRIKDIGPLKLTVNRTLVDPDDEATLGLEGLPQFQSGELELRWGDGPRQARYYMLTQNDMLEMHEWLSKTLGLED